MKALYFDEHGDPEVLKYGDLPDPVPGPNQALIRVKAAALNHLDLFVRRGGSPVFDRLPKPHITGSDASGVVEAYGPGTDASIAIGTRVAIDPGITTTEDEWTRRGEDSVSPGYRMMGEDTPGAAAEFVVVPVQNLLPLPDHISHEEAAAVSLVGLTAWRMLIHRAQLKAGETVAIVGVGGLNSLVIQLAKQLGATVYVVTSSEEKMEKAKALGADHAINYKTEDWSKAVFLATQKRGVDVVVDNVGQATWTQSLRALARGGRLVTVGRTSGYEAMTDVRLLFVKQISIIGSTMGSHQDYRDMMQWVFEGKLKPVIYKTIPLREGREAHEILERGEQFGKVVLIP